MLSLESWACFSNINVMGKNNGEKLANTLKCAMPYLFMFKAREKWSIALEVLVWMGRLLDKKVKYLDILCGIYLPTFIKST